MAHFAQVKNGKVLKVIVAEQEHINRIGGNWVQTSYNTRAGVHYKPDTNEPSGEVALRKNFATVGGVYDSTKDAFYAAQPYASWILDETTCIWGPPTPKPEFDPSTGKNYEWNETSKQWVEI